MLKQRKIPHWYIMKPFNPPCYKFYKASCFLGQGKDYFVRENLHMKPRIQTVGRVVYTPDNILLESLECDGNIKLFVQTNVIPKNGCYVYMFGTFSYFQDLCKNIFYEFDENSDIFTPVLNMDISNEISSEEEARELETSLFILNAF